MKRLLLFSFLLVLWPALGASADFTVIVNKSNPVNEMPAADVGAKFMKKTTKWPDGTLVVPVDQIESAPVRARFSGEILRKAPAAVKSYWRQQIFGGLDVPPLEKASDREVIEFVRANPGAIGYVSNGDSLDGVKAVVVR